MEQHFVLVVSENVDLSDLQDLTQLLNDVGVNHNNETSKDDGNKFEEQVELQTSCQTCTTDSSCECKSVAIQADNNNLPKVSTKFHSQNDVEDDDDYIPEKNTDKRNTRRSKTEINFENKTQLYTCQICLREFRQKGNLKAHLRVHTDEKPFNCNSCDKGFKSKEALLRHQYSHTGEKPYTCDLCNQGFSSSLALKEHQARHNNQVLYECKICNRGFRHVSALKRHSTIHSDATPYSCDICGRKFAQKSYVRSHQRSHTGERPFPCDKCGKCFAHPSDLSRHKIIHTGKKPFVCKLCGARFSDPSSHRRHERDHSTEKNFTCPSCDQSFKRASQLKRHASKCKDAITTDGCLIRVLETPHDDSALDLVSEPSESNTNDNNESIIETTVVVETETDNLPELTKLIQERDYIHNPDFSSQDYYDWLSNFTSLVKLLTIPIENTLFTQISHVHKTLADVLAKPSGVLSNRENFQIMMDISHNLHNVITAHLCYVLNSLDEKE